MEIAVNLQLGFSWQSLLEWLAADLIELCGSMGSWDRRCSEEAVRDGEQTASLLGYCLLWR